MASLASFSSSATATCTKPSGTASGDVLVALVGAVGGSPTITGWTSRAAVSNSGFYFHSIFTKVAGGSEPPSYTASAPIVESLIIFRVTDADTTAIVDGTATTATTGTCASITTTVADSLLIMGSLSSGTITPDGSMAEVVETGPGPTYGVYANAATEARPTAGATGSRTQTPAGPIVASVMVAIKGASSAVSPTVEPPNAVATALANAPVVMADARVLAPAATAAAAAPAPSAGVWATVQPPAATATAQANAPQVVAHALISLPTATATASATPPTVLGEKSALIVVPTATASSSVMTPGLVADALIAAIAAEANATAHAPGVGIYATVSVPAATATASAIAPVYALGASVAVPTATAAATASAPLAGQIYTGAEWNSRSFVRMSSREATDGAVSARPLPTGEVRQRPSHHARSEAR